MMRPIIFAALLVASGTAVTAGASEIKRAAYPKSKTNTYKLPIYPLQGSSDPHLELCPNTTAGGLSFHSDGQTFRLEPVPTDIDWLTGFVTLVKVRRGQGTCFDLELRVVAPILEAPDAARWRLEWSPHRPTAFDVVVSSAELSQSALMQSTHTLQFPWHRGPAQPGGRWVSCEIECRWRVDITDSRVAREFLGRATMSVEVNSRVTRGLPSGTALFSPSGSRIQDYFPETLTQWTIDPPLRRVVVVPVGATSVSLEHLGAFALAPGPANDPAFRVLPTESWPSLLLPPGWADEPKLKTLELSLVQPQAPKATLELRVRAASSHLLRYIGKAGAKELKLPPGLWWCGDGAGKNSVPISELGKELAVLSAQAAPSATQCASADEKVSISVEPPVLRAADVSLALDWSPDKPRRLDVYVRSAALASDATLRADTVLDAGGHPPGTWIGCEGEYCHYRIEDLETNGGLIAPVFELRSQRLGGDAKPVLDIETGEPLLPQRTQRVTQWVIKDPLFRARMMIPGGVGTDTDQLRALIEHPLARFVKVGQSISSCPTSGVTCAVRAGAHGPELEVARKSIKVQEPATVELTLARDVTVVALSQGTWPDAASKVNLVVSFASCRYRFRQLSTALGGVNEATVLFEALLESGTSDQCSGRDWTIDLEGDAARGRGEVRQGLLEIVFEALPAPPNGAAKRYAMKLDYPTGQDVELAQSASLQVNAARNLLADREVLVRLPGGERSPLHAFGKLAAGRPNILALNAIAEPLGWQLEILGARSLYSPCPGAGGAHPSALQAAGENIKFEAAYGGYCIVPSRVSTDPLELRATRWAATERLLLPGVDPSRLPEAELKKERSAGWMKLETGLTSAAYRLAMDLAALTSAGEPAVTLRCGNRTLKARRGAGPKAVEYDQLANCVLRIQLGAPVTEAGSTLAPLDQTLAFFGEQRIKVIGRVIKESTVSDPETLDTIVIKPGVTSQGILTREVALTEIGAEPIGDWGLVELEVAQDDTFYFDDGRWSVPKSSVTLRVRRGPEYLGYWTESGKGVRGFATFTAAIASMFRYPHSSKAAITSQQAAGLETAGIGAGILAILEPWDFDENEGLIPVLNPQAQLGFLLSSIPSSSDLALPSFSIVFGLGLRTGVGTGPASGTESALKVLLWYEALWQASGRGHDPSSNLLFGFGVDLGSLGS